jgi:membrane protein
MASLFSLYLQHFTRFSMTYGSLGGVVLTLLFLHASAMLFIYGAEFNATASSG